VSPPSLGGLLVSHWQPAWSLDLSAALCAAIYVAATRRLRRGWPRHRALSFLAGVAVILLALQSGIGSFDDRMLSVHMVQHMLLLLVAPLLLLAGRPAILAMSAVPRRHRPALARTLARARRFTGPLQCLSVFYAVVLLTHLGSFYDATLTRPALHDGEHVLYLIAGLMLWWPILDGDPAPGRRLGGLGRLVYVIAAMLPMAIAGAYLNRDPTLAYPAYGSPAHALGLSPLDDQQQAGAIMWVAGDLIMVAVGLWAALVALVAEERHQRERDARAATSGGALG
jgi:putative membrane protein